MPGYKVSIQYDEPNWSLRSGRVIRFQCEFVVTADTPQEAEAEGRALLRAYQRDSNVAWERVVREVTVAPCEEGAPHPARAVRSTAKPPNTPLRRRKSDR